ncbi:MAG TPA: HAMP domain-containing sensor histidine kinase [Longimicrobiaceae bacterium]|nr:HAMP domain-containing sensor histidine kinase [Longimicrobiaceae bacterium]
MSDRESSLAVRTDGQAADSLARISSPLLASAARRVAEVWRDQAGEALGEAEVVEDLTTLALALESADNDAAIELVSESPAVLRRRLLELLRAEVVAEWERGDDLPDPQAMVRLLGRFERVRRALEPNWDQYFSSRLMGPEGLELVMEIAHDLRSPLTSILFLAETLRRGQSGEINDIQHRQLGIVYSAALGLTSVVSDVIELARGGNRLMDREPSPFSVAEIFESVHDIVQPMAEEKGLTMRFLPPASDQRLGYPTALSRVLLNLTSNALKFTDDGFVEILAQEKAQGRVEFSVRDTGRGLKAEVLRNLYRPFRRARGRSGYTFSGSGLGLAISRKLVEAMGGELELETNPAWGTRFFFELDLPAATLF